MADRAWMYSGWQYGQIPSNLWLEQTNRFLDHAFSSPSVAGGDKIKCPCAKCSNYFKLSRDEVEKHLYKHGFRENYEIWSEHGEKYLPRHDGSAYATYCVSRDGIDQMVDRMDNMLVDLAGNQPPPIEEEPTSTAKAFYRMVSSADEIVHENTTHSRLSAVARLLAMKSQYNMSIAHYDDVLQIIHELMPPDANLSKDFYQSKKLLEGLGMPYVKIDVCKNNCMLYYKDNEYKEKCDICNTPRYEEGPNKVPYKVLRYLPIKDRLQRLYAHRETSKYMQSHSRSKSDKMVHPCDDDDTLDDKGKTAADRVKEVFWNLFEVHVKDDEDPYKVEEDADRVLDNYAMKKVRDMMYQLRVDAVKFYFEKKGERLDDTLACSKELEYAQYLEGRIPWFKEHAWPHLCVYWCSKQFKSLRKRGQESRFKSADVAQNRGGSLPFVEARQILAVKYGPEKATVLNTYAAMKSGLKNWDGSGSTSSNLRGKSKKRFDDYSDLARAAHPDDWEHRELDVQILYESSGGLPHGRLAIADGAIKKADVIYMSREKKLRPSTSAAHRRTLQENEELKQHNENLQRKVDMHERLLVTILKEMGKELPPELQPGESFQPHGTTNSFHTGHQAVDGNTVHGDLGANGGANDNSSGNTTEQAINKTNLCTNNARAGGGDPSSNNYESES